MDQALLAQLTRQLKILNFWITIFGSLILVSFIIIIFLLFKVVSFVQDTSQKVSDLQEKTSSTLNVKQQLCDSKSLTDFLQDKSELCTDNR